MQPSEFADLVVMTVKASLAPVLERLAAAETKLAMLQSTEKSFNEMPKLIAAAVKSQLPVAPVPEPVDLEPLRLQIKALEAREPMPGPAGKDGLDGKDGAPGLVGQVGPAGEIGPCGPQGTAGRDGLDGKDGVPGLVGQAGERGERGPEGPQGTPGRDGRDGIQGIAGEKAVDGKNGKDGIDGLGWDDLVVDYDNDRTFTINVVRGDRRKSVGSFTVPYMIYRGVYVEGRAYKKSDTVTYAGSLWIVNEDTTDKPEMSRMWTLVVKRGRDGRDGMLTPPEASPVVKVGKIEGSTFT